jgi:anti-sigma B factor antagonist
LVNVIPHQHGNVIVLSLSGDINISNVEMIENAYEEQIAQKPEVISINCKNLNSIDSSGLGLFIKLFKIAEKENIDFVIIGIVGNVSALFDLSKLDNLFPIMDEDEFKIRYLS